MMDGHQGTRSSRVSPAQRKRMRKLDREISQLDKRWVFLRAIGDMKGLHKVYTKRSKLDEQRMDLRHAMKGVGSARRQ